MAVTQRMAPTKPKKKKRPVSRPKPTALPKPKKASDLDKLMAQDRNRRAIFPGKGR